jgi:hypothetical protein
MSLFALFPSLPSPSPIPSSSPSPPKPKHTKPKAKAKAKIRTQGKNKNTDINKGEDKKTKAKIRTKTKTWIKSKRLSFPYVPYSTLAEKVGRSVPYFGKNADQKYVLRTRNMGMLPSVALAYSGFGSLDTSVPTHAEYGPWF